MAEKQQIHWRDVCLWVRVELLEGRCESKRSETKGTRRRVTNLGSRREVTQQQRGRLEEL